MLFPGRTETNLTTDAIVVRPHHKAVDEQYFCPSLSCLSDDLLARRTSSFRGVWLVTEAVTERTWLVRADQPSCPHCGSPLCAIVDDMANEQSAIDYAVTEYLLADYSLHAEPSARTI